MRALILRSSLLVSTLACSALAIGCDSGDGNKASTDPTTTTETTVQPTNTTSEPDTTSTDPDTTEPETPAYPAGPYGTEAPDPSTGHLDTIKDLSFLEPWTGQTVHLHDYYKSEDVKVILISSGAGWCTACQYEAWDLHSTYEKYHADGLEVLYTLYQDVQGKALWRDGASDSELDADFTFMNEWHDNLGAGVGLEPTYVANYPTLVDVGFEMGEFYNQNATPLTLIVRVSDMKILYRQVGYSSGAVDTIVKSVLFQ